MKLLKDHHGELIWGLWGQIFQCGRGPSCPLEQTVINICTDVSFGRIIALIIPLKGGSRIDERVSSRFMTICSYAVRHILTLRTPRRMTVRNQRSVQYCFFVAFSFFLLQFSPWSCAIN